MNPTKSSSLMMLQPTIPSQWHRPLVPTKSSPEANSANPAHATLVPKPLMAMLDSKIADLRNTGERYGGALTAGLFLEQFNEGKRWMHVDIAGPAIVDKPFGINTDGCSGVPVATILPPPVPPSGPRSMR